MTKTHFIVVRHGETEWNVQGKWMGQLDSPLTPTGLEQARLLACRLQHVPFDAIYSSDLGRAVETATVIAKKKSLQITLDVRLRERHLGVLQGLTVPEMRERHVQARTEYERLEYDYVIPQGESARQRVERAMACLEDVKLKHPGGSVLIVTHGGILTGFFQQIVGVSPQAARRFSLLNAAINVFVCEDDRWTLRTWGDIAHLETTGTLDEF